MENSELNITLTPGTFKRVQDGNYKIDKMLLYMHVHTLVRNEI